jgi:hypothetical protein
MTRKESHIHNTTQRTLKKINNKKISKAFLYFSFVKNLLLVMIYKKSDRDLEGERTK